jgi:tRNA(Ile)-lysidine synthase
MPAVLQRGRVKRYIRKNHLRLSKTKIKSWCQAATGLGDAIPLARLHPRVRAWINEHARANETWAVAVSGGADSVALLLLLWAHFPEKRKQLLVLHFDHALRPDSADDAKFVQKLSASLGVSFATARRAPGGAFNEAALREARMKFFREQLAARQGRLIFFGHQRDDIAETMLMRLARGSGASGLCAPRPAREFPDGLVPLRPLLDIERAELREALQKSGAVWREDSSATASASTFCRRGARRKARANWRPAWRARARRWRMTPKPSKT